MLPLPLIHYWHQAKRCYTYFYIRLIANKTHTFTRTHSSSVIRSVRPESCNVFFFVLTFFSFFPLLVLRLISFFSLSFPWIFGWNLTWWFSLQSFLDDLSAFFPPNAVNFLIYNRLDFLVLMVFLAMLPGVWLFQYFLSNVINFQLLPAWNYWVLMVFLAIFPGKLSAIRI